MITFNRNDLKTYISKKTGYKVSSIHSIDNYPMHICVDFKIIGNEGQTMKVNAYCTLWNQNSIFLWSETVYFIDFIKFLRLRKLHKINKLEN